MCMTCGCGDAAGRDTTIDGRAMTGHRHHRGGDAHNHHHPDIVGDARLIQVGRDLLGKNNELAAANRRHFRDSETFVVNLVSSPGSGKTTLLARTAADLKARFPVTVIEGDQQTCLDAQRIRDAGVPAVQINTGKVCHLDAHMIGHAVEDLDLRRHGVLFIENVGNLVCPAEFDLGEHHKVVVMSVTEGEDKPLKYPHMFAAASLMLLNKIDLLPHVAFDVGRCRTFARRANPDGFDLGECSLQCRTLPDDAGLHRWYDWIEGGIEKVSAGRAQEGSALHADG